MLAKKDKEEAVDEADLSFLSTWCLWLSHVCCEFENLLLKYAHYERNDFGFRMQSVGVVFFPFYPRWTWMCYVTIVSLFLVGSCFSCSI